MTASSRKPLPGWTWVFAVQKMFVALLWCWFAALSLHLAWTTGRASSGPAAFLRALIVTRGVIALVFVMLIAGGLLRIARRDPGTRRYWLAALPALWSTVALVTAMNVLQTRFMVRAGMPEPDVTAELVANVVLNAATAAAWWLYWLRSRRVRLTFEPDWGWEAEYRRGVEERAREEDAAKAMAAGSA